MVCPITQGDHKEITGQKYNGLAAINMRRLRIGKGKKIEETTGRKYTVSHKTSQIWLAITLTHMNGF